MISERVSVLPAPGSASRAVRDDLRVRIGAP